MAAKYWLKLYYEILDDPKLAMLRPATKWRFVECLLVAGECDDNGFIPDTPQLAWRIRADAEQLETDLLELVKAGLLQKADGRWFVVKFAERQAPVSDAERMRRFRERQQKAEYYADDTQPLPNGYVPVTNRNADTDTDTDADKIQMQKQSAPAPAAIYADVTGFWPTPINTQRINDALGNGPIDKNTLQRAFDLWLDCGYSASNPAMCEWYHNLVADPNWIPPKKRQANGQAESAEDRLARIFANEAS